MWSVVQTHISVVFLAGDEVYKIKKPVRFAFLDFSTLERRRHFCHEEVRLNRRLAATPIAASSRSSDAATASRWPPDDAADARRIRRAHAPPAGRAYARPAAGRDEVRPALIDRIAARLVAFHAAAEAGPEIAPAAIRRCRRA